LRTGTRRSLPRGCVVGAHEAGRWFLLCLHPEPADPGSAFLPRVIALLGAHGWRGILGPPPLGGAGPRVGAWSSVAVSPDGRHLLGQWSNACGTPVAVFADANGRH